MWEPEPGELATGLLESVPDLVYLVDLDGRIRWCNERLVAVTGYERTELIGMDVFDLIPSDHREEALEVFSQAGSYDPEETFEFDVLTSDGRRIPHEFNGSVLEVDGRTVVSTIARDISERREREAALRRQHDELETLNRISETVYEVIQAVIDAASREEIEAVVCERLAASGLYCAVWVGRREPDGTVERQMASGTDEFIELIERFDEMEWQRPASVAAETGEIQVIQNAPEADVPEVARRKAVEMDIGSGTAVPLVHRGTVLGVLCVYSARPEAFSEREQAAFERLGGVIGFAISAVRTERLLLSDTATELTFRLAGSDAFLASVSSLADGACHHEWSTPVDSGSGTYRHYVTVSGVDPEAVLEVGAEKPTVESIEYVGEDGDSHVFEVVTNDSVIRRLFEAGATPTSVVARDGETTMVAELPGDADIRPVVEAAEALYDAELVSKRELERPVRTTDEFHDAVAEQLTGRQQAAIRHAFFNGYFSWPRDATAEEIAETMDISSATLHYHLRRAQRTLIEVYLEHLEN